MHILTDIFVNLVSDLLSWVIVGATLGLFALSGATRHRRRLFDFFGLSGSQPKIQVYISRVNIKPGGATMIGGEEWPTFQGPVVSAREFMVLPTLNRLTQSPLLDNLPRSVRNWLGSKRHSLANIEVDFQPSPSVESEIAGDAVIFLGSRLVNIGTRYYQDKSLSIVEFDSEKHELVITYGSLKGTRIKPSEGTIVINGEERPANDLAIVQRLYDSERKRTVIIVAGTGSNGTMAATSYLVNHWEELYRRFGHYERTNFAIVVECPNRRVAESGYLFPTKRSEFAM